MAIDMTAFKRTAVAGKTAKRSYVSYTEGTEGYIMTKKLRDQGINVELLVTHLLKKAMEK